MTIEIITTLMKALWQHLRLPASKISFWNGRAVRLGDGDPQFTLHFRSAKALKIFFLDIEYGFAQAYTKGWIDVDGDFKALLASAYRSEFPRWASTGRKLRRHVQALVQRNPFRDSRYNIAHHYDLGNDFFRLWLDENMLYTCAYYPRVEASLEQAQLAKMDLICRKLRLRRGDRVVEAGCGWGGFAIFAARHYGVRVHAYNVSREQILYAREWAKREGLSTSVEFVEEDYRSIRGEYDVFVSIGMLEHVGSENYAAFGKIIARTLRPGGRGLLHFIGRQRPGEVDPWITRFIFPGGHVPALTEVLPVFEENQFYVLDIENLRLHYARTLEQWLERFECAAEKIRLERGDEFVRMWRLYLEGSRLAFLYGHLLLYQIVFTHRLNNDEPVNRSFLYSKGEEIQKWNATMPLSWEAVRQDPPARGN